ncbi:PREDICTED: tripartite motif-containing protein 7-like [Nanorana parkeri]|uniref:tripartite motif-containing protein 7-like n=1 Tax=Nanorana parkeri TaxID=125878 RepID=UPI00085460CC|nr:PREDICTED: tripartite motif-containing protein 7-like [Nanorana parkeri]
MASADVREELNCSICLDVYKDPVTLRCGHNFCRACIDRVLDTQEASGGYSCPDCREKIQDRSALSRNVTLHNIAERFHSAQPAQEESGIFCTYCDFSVPAVKTCLLCEASLCGKHLKKHGKSLEHVLVDPTTSLENRKCSIHKKILEYYCTEDSTCICVSCCLVGEHGGHAVESIDDASEKKRIKLRTILEELTSKREQGERKAQTLLRHKKKVEKKLTGETGRITALFRDLRKEMDDLEKRALSEIDRQEKRIMLSFSDLIQQQEVEKDELSKKMHYIEELCNATDPLAILKERQSETMDLCHPEEVENQDTGKDGNVLCNVGDLDKNLISLTLHSGLSNMVSRLKNEIHIQEAVDVSMDRNTVSNFLQIEDDLKRAYYTKSQQHPDSPERFEDCQVFSTRGFSSGQNFWEVETSRTGNWMIGVAYASIERKGEHSFIGNNDKSWCLCKVSNKKYSVMHDSKTIQLPDKCSSQRLVIYLDYKAGRLSFYELGEAVRHLYTFSATFTQPLHAAFYIWDEWLRIRS